MIARPGLPTTSPITRMFIRTGYRVGPDRSNEPAGGRSWILSRPGQPCSSSGSRRARPGTSRRWRGNRRSRPRFEGSDTSMTTTRRRFVRTGLLGAAVAGRAISARSGPAHGPAARDPRTRYPRLDEILRQPVLKRELFATPVIIETLELLRYKDSFLCRVRSRDGAEGISVGHSGLKRSTRFSSTTCSRSLSAKTRGTWTCSWKRFSSMASISGTTAFPSARPWPPSSLPSSTCWDASPRSPSAS